MRTLAASDPAVAIAAVERACAGAADGNELFESVDRELERAIPHDGSMWFAVDPATLLAVAPSRIASMDAGYCGIFWHNEFHEQDANLYNDLARSGVAAAGLRAATDDQPRRSRRYRDFLQPQGYDDELRGLLQAGRTTWAVAGLYRERGRPPFSAEETSLMSSISTIVGAACRVRANLAAASTGFDGAPGLLVFDERDGLVSANDSARAWLAELFDSCADSARDWLAEIADLPRHDLEAGSFGIIPVIAHARAVAAGLEHRPARLRLRGRTGRWVVVHGTCLRHPDGTQSVAVVMEAARTADIAPIIIEAYGLTSREREVVRELARGTPTPDIARHLFLSVHTVRDHVKSIFEKLGVTSRGELVAKLFSDHYVDDMHAAAVHVD